MDIWDFDIVLMWDTGMTIIKAKGIRNGKPLAVTFLRVSGEDTYIFNHHLDESIESEIKTELKLRHPFGGTYYPEEQSELNILNVLENYFFDERPEIETDGEFETIPGEDGVIY